MSNQKKERRAFLIALLIAILVHLGILLLLFLHRELKKDKPEFAKEKPVQPKAPVKFVPEPEKSHVDKVPDKQIPPIPPSATLIPGSHSKENIIDGQDKGTTTDRRKAKPIKESMQLKQEQEQVLEESDKSETVKHKPIISDDLKKPSTEGLSKEDAKKFSKRITKIKKSREQQLPQILDRSNADAPVLKNVIEGFSKWMNEEGNNPYLERHGSKDGKIDFEEAKLLSYFNKLIDFFHNASEPFSDRIQKLILRYMEKHTDEGRISGFYRLIIGPKGELEDIRVVQESGLKEYDRMIVEQFKRAAPFPPIPKHLNKDKVIFPITIYTPFSGNYPYMKF